MFYTVYKITNLINNKIYIGVHKTENQNDNYMGSGKILNIAKKKYGIENFEKEILEVFDNPEEMFEMESKLVNENFVLRTDTYNLREGGLGCWDYTNKNLTIEQKRSYAINAGKQFCELIKNDSEFREYFRKRCSENNPYGFKNKSHTEETKKKIGEASSKHQKGDGNSQYGTIWIHSLKEKRSKKIKKEDLSKWESKGWIKGRKMKFF